MNITLRIPLNTNAEQHARLAQLQSAIAGVCNVLSPAVQHTKVWNHVALHHLKYRCLREQFPDIGSQMVCNDTTSVLRTCRTVFQHSHSLLNLVRLGNKPLPMLKFSDNSPVYFDRHTSSVNKGQLSMNKLDGRLRLALSLRVANEAGLVTKKLREIDLSRRPDGAIEEVFQFGVEPVHNLAQSRMSIDFEFLEYAVVEGAQ